MGKKWRSRLVLSLEVGEKLHGENVDRNFELDGIVLVDRQAFALLLQASPLLLHIDPEQFKLFIHDQCRKFSSFQSFLVNEPYDKKVK